MSDYDPQKDAHDSYYAAIEAKRARGDAQKQPSTAQTTTCIEHAYGTTQRLSFQIKVF